MEVLICNNLKKKVKEKVIVENISFTINKGDIVGLIGPNGAGKTTVIKLILGLIKITEGSVKINGFDIEKNFVKAIEKVGAIVENPDLYMYLSGYDNLKITANNFKNISKSRIDEVAKLVGLENRLRDKVSTYSLGMRQRLGIAEAIINKPDLLILDEPTNGLDVEGTIEIRKLIKSLSNDGIAILVSSHNLNEIDNLCNRIIAIKNGKIISDEKIEEFKAYSKESTFILELNTINKLEKAILDYKFEILEKNKIRVYISKEDISQLMQNLITHNYQVYSVNEEEMTSEEAFIKKVGDNKID